MADLPGHHEQEIRGRIGRVIFRDEDTGRTFALFRTEDGRTVAVSGDFTPEDIAARELTLTGVLGQGKKGPVFRVRRGGIWRGPPSRASDPPAAGIERLCAAIFRGQRFGDAAARKLVAALGREAWNALTREPYALAAHVGGVDRALKLHRIVVELGVPRARALAHLMGLGLSYAYAQRVLEHLGSDAIEVLRKNPYEMIGVPGIQFPTADRIARNGFGIDLVDPRRLRALSVSVLEQAAADGHTSLPLAATLAGVADVADVRDRGVTELDLVQEAVRAGALVEDMGDIYLPRMHDAEVRAADGLARLLLRGHRPLPFGVQADPDLSGYTPEQRDAIHLGLTAPICLITGRPGTGKTTVAREIVRLAQRMGVPVTLTATTGKAADRLTESILGDVPRPVSNQLELTSEEMKVERAQTIHSLVGNRSPGRPLPPGIVIIDETSMMDLPLLARIMDNAGEHTSIVMLGDPNQLPPVVAGNSSRDIRDSSVIPTIELTRVHRQGANTLIAINADRILAGEQPILIDAGNPGAAEAALAAHGKANRMPVAGVRMDSFFVDAGEVEQAPARVLQVMRRLQERGFDIVRDVQFYTPMHRGYAGTHNLNRLLQRELNPAGMPVRTMARFRLRLRGMSAVRSLGVSPGDAVSVSHGVLAAGVPRGASGRVRDVRDSSLLVEFGQHGVVEVGSAEVDTLSLDTELVLRVGDPVVQTENDKSRRLANGMKGVVRRRRDGGGVVVEFDGRPVEYTAAQARKLQVAYATTVHKGQGQEQPVSVLVAHHSEHAKMLERSLFYVAHTRAKQMFVCVGTRKALFMGLREARGQMRKTRLAERTSNRLLELRARATPAALYAARTAALLADRPEVSAPQPPKKGGRTLR